MLSMVMGGLPAHVVRWVAYPRMLSDARLQLLESSYCKKAYPRFSRVSRSVGMLVSMMVPNCSNAVRMSSFVRRWSRLPCTMRGGLGEELGGKGRGVEKWLRG